MTETLGDFLRWKDSISVDTDCTKIKERGMKTCIPSFSRLCCQRCFRERDKV